MEDNHKLEDLNHFSNSTKHTDNFEVMDFSHEGTDANRDATVLTSISDNHCSPTFHRGQEILNNNHEDMKVSDNDGKIGIVPERTVSALNNKHSPAEVNYNLDFNEHISGLVEDQNQISSFESGNENPKIVTDGVNWHSMKEMSFNLEITDDSTKSVPAASQISEAFQSSGEGMNINFEPNEENLMPFNNLSEVVTHTSDITNGSLAILSHVPEIIIHSPKTMHGSIQDSPPIINWNMNDVNNIPEAMTYSLETNEQGGAVNDILELSTDITKDNRSEPFLSNHEDSMVSSSSNHEAVSQNPDDTIHDVTRHNPEAVSSIRITNHGLDTNNQILEDIYCANSQEATEVSQEEDNNFDPNKDSKGASTDNHAINFLAHNAFNHSDETLHSSKTIKHIFDFLVDPSSDIMHQSDQAKATTDNITHEYYTHEDLCQKPAAKVEILCLDSLNNKYSRNNSYSLAANAECPEIMICNKRDTDQKPSDLKQNPTSAIKFLTMNELHSLYFNQVSLPKKSGEVFAKYISLPKIVKSILIFILGSIIPGVMIIVGSKNLERCPFQSYIPIYLIVSGVCGVGQESFSMLKKMIKMKRDSKYDDQEDYRESAETNWIFFCNLLQAVLSILNFCWSIAVGFLIVLAILNIIPIVMIIVGAVYLNNCRAEPNIPIFLIVGGVFTIVKSIIQMINRVRLQKMTATDPDAKLKQCDPLNLFDSILSLFLFIWLIVGSIWVFRIAMPEFNDETKPAYCHRGLYLSTYILLVIEWICVLFFLLIMCFCLGPACCIGIGCCIGVGCCIELAEVLDDGHHGREPTPV